MLDDYPRQFLIKSLGMVSRLHQLQARNHCWPGPVWQYLYTPFHPSIIHGSVVFLHPHMNSREHINMDIYINETTCDFIYLGYWVSVVTVSVSIYSLFLLFTLLPFTHSIITERTLSSIPRFFSTGCIAVSKGKERKPFNICQNTHTHTVKYWETTNTGALTTNCSFNTAFCLSQTFIIDLHFSECSFCKAFSGSNKTFKSSFIQM